MPQRTRRTSRNIEIATIRNNINGYGYSYGGNNRIQPKDSVLIERGMTRGYEALRDVLKDCHALAVTQKRWLSVTEREWEVKPASENRIDKKAADLVKYQLESIASFDENLEGGELVPNIYGGFDQICYNLLKAELYGFQPAEVIWGSDGKEIYPKQIKDKSPSRFVYTAGDKGYRFRLLTPQNIWEGVSLPPKKFIIHTFHPSDDNPYGWGLGSRLFYPVMFKRRLAEYGLVFADKFGSPTGKASYPNGREDLKDTLLQAMNDMAQESGIVIPEECNFEWMAIATGGGEVYTNLMDYFDREISKAVLGETGSTDQQGSGGSRARDQVGNEVRIEITKASSDFLSATLNRSLIPWIVKYNFGDKAKPPSVWRKFPELEQKEDLNSRAQRDNTISTMMERKPTEDYIIETYNIELEEPEEEEEENGLNNELAGIFDPSNEAQENENDQAVELSEESVLKDTASHINRYPLLANQPFDFAQAKKILKWNGLEIGVEYFPGDRRHNKTLKSGYGHIRGTKGADGMALDAYFHSSILVPKAQSLKPKIYKITQLDKDSNFDEHKYMLGYSSKNAAKKAYLKQMPKAMFGGIKKVTLAELKSDSVKPTQAKLFANQAVKAIAPEVDTWRSLVNDEVQRINQLNLPDNEKYVTLQNSLVQLYSEMDDDAYAEILGSAIAASEFAGRYEVMSNE